MTTHSTTLNDVDLAAVGELVAAIGDEPAKAQTRWSATVDWDGGFRSTARIRQFDAYPSDEPEGLGGTDTAPNPVEQVLAALGNCLAVGYAANASATGIELRNVRIDVEGDVDLHTFLGLADDNAGYSHIRVDVALEADAEPGQLEELHQRVVATSPVGHTLSRPVPVEIHLA